MSFTEANYENAIVELLTDRLGYGHVYGPDVTRDYRSPLMPERLVAALSQINPTLPGEAITEALHKLTNFEGGTPIQKNARFTDWLQNGIEVNFHHRGEQTSDLVRLVDYDLPEHNDFCVAKGIKFFDGVEEYFDKINAYAKSKGIKIEHYIISSGLREILKGTKIFKHFENVYASAFEFDVNGVAKWPALAVDYTNKTQFLFRINKGIKNSWDNSQINKHIKEEDRPIPFSRMVYIGDGETDIPAMKMTNYQGGTSIAVYNPNVRAKKGKKSPKQICQELIAHGRATYIAPADYSETSELFKLLTNIIDKIALEVELKRHTQV